MNLSLFLAINHFAARTAWAHSVMAAFALWAGLVVLVALLALAWVGHRGRADTARATATAVLTGVAAVAALGLNQLAAATHYEARPFVAHPGITVALQHTADNAFPSDHAVIAGALATGIVLFARRWGIVAALVALALAFARIYVGVHYPDDVVVGLALGVVVALVLVLGLTPTLTRALQHRLPAPAQRLAGIPAPAVPI
jgi:membrane-associated phospholipid phosphatase